MPQYCTVHHRIDSIKIDGEDPDRNPDRIPVTGTIIFTPLLAQGDSVVITENDVKSTLNIEPVTAQIQLGQLMHRGELGVKLFAGGENSNPERIRWRATFKHLIAGTTKITLKDVVFEAIPGGELSLSLTQPVPAKPYPGFSQNLEEALQAITEAGENTAIELEAIVTEAESVARTTAQQELSAALPAKADKVHTHTTAQVTGLDAALVGKATQTTLDTRVPAGLALRLDTTVGTRIFAGGTILYGNTNWRQLHSSSIPPNWGTITPGNQIQIRRDANQVTLRFAGYSPGTDDGVRKITTLPAGFRPSVLLLSETISNRDQVGVRMEMDLAVNGEITATKPPTGGRHYGTLTFVTGDSWPTVLP